jgi:hypothetical protein
MIVPLWAGIVHRRRGAKPVAAARLRGNDGVGEALLPAGVASCHWPARHYGRPAYSLSVYARVAPLPDRGAVVISQRSMPLW